MTVITRFSNTGVVFKLNDALTGWGRLELYFWNVAIFLMTGLQAVVNLIASYATRIKVILRSKGTVNLSVLIFSGLVVGIVLGLLGL